MILPKERDLRFVTIRRGGTLTDEDHHLLALWAALCAEHVLQLFEAVRPEDGRKRQAIEQVRGSFMIFGDGEQMSIAHGKGGLFCR